MDPSEPSAVPTPRRRFLSRLSLALSGLIATATTVPVIGFLLSPLTRKQPRVWRAVGPVSGFTIGETVNVVFEDADVRIDYPVWSPDGRRVLFDRAAPHGGDLWLLDGIE